MYVPLVAQLIWVHSHWPRRPATDVCWAGKLKLTHSTVVGTGGNKAPKAECGVKKGLLRSREQQKLSVVDAAGGVAIVVVSIARSACCV